MTPTTIHYSFLLMSYGRYHPRGNSKFGAIELSTPPKSDQSILRYRLFVDGKETWSYFLQSPVKGNVVGRAKDAVWG